MAALQLRRRLQTMRDDSHSFYIDTHERVSMLVEYHFSHRTGEYFSFRNKRKYLPLLLNFSCGKFRIQISKITKKCYAVLSEEMFDNIRADGYFDYDYLWNNLVVGHRLIDHDYDGAPIAIHHT